MTFETRLSDPPMVSLRRTGVTVTTEDGITVEVTGISPVFDAMLTGMFKSAMKRIKEHRKELAK